MHRLTAFAATVTMTIHAASALIVLFLLASMVLPGHGPVLGAIVLALAVTGADAALTWPLRRLAGATAGRL